MARPAKRSPAAPRAIVRIRPADVVNGRTLTDEQSAVFKDAVETLKRGEETEDAAMANRGRQRLRAMARDLGLLNEMDKAFADLNETALARLRMNDDVRAGGADGRVRVWDGIDQAHRNGDLDGLRVSADSLLALGTTYRQAFVGIEPGQADDTLELNIPVKWVSYIKNTISEIAPHFTMKRQLDDYIRQYYNPLFKRSRIMAGKNYEMARHIASWKRKVMRGWESIEIVSVKTPDSNAKLAASKVKPRAV